MPLQIKKFLNQKDHQTVLTKQDLDGMQQLLENGFSLQETMLLLENNKNRSIFEFVRNELSKGNKLSEFFYQCIPKKYIYIMQGFLEYISFPKSLSLTLTMVEDTERRFSKIKQKLLYPILLFMGTIIGLIFFNQICLPTLMDLCISFGSDIAKYTFMQKTINLLVCLIVLILIGSVSMFLYFRKDDHVKKLYFFLYDHRNNSLFIKVYSLSFMYYFMECIKMGLSTNHTLEILERLAHKPIVNLFATNIKNSLLQGEEFIYAIKENKLDSDLIKFMQIAVYAKKKEQILEGYITFAESYINKEISKITTILQCGTYIAIGLLIIVIYQILLIPLSLITQL